MQKLEKREDQKDKKKGSFKLLKQKLSDPLQKFQIHRTNLPNETRFNKTKGRVYEI